MVSYHPEWDDVEDGYRRGSTGIFVSPAIVRSGSHGSAHRSGDISTEDANAYSVELRTRMETASETWDPIANFEDQRTAWEFAHLLSHFFEVKHEPSSAKSDLLTVDPNYPGDSKTLPDIVENMSAQEAFLTLLHPHPTPESMDDLLEENI
jgi:hypothetical protein